MFKISYPAEFHSQTAVEAAIDIHNELKKLGLNSGHIKNITIKTHEACIRIIDKKGPLKNPADRDHCIQYMVAVPLIFGRLTAYDYEDVIATDVRIDQLRKKIVCIEDKSFTKDYHDPKKRSIANALTVELKNGKISEYTIKPEDFFDCRQSLEGLSVTDAKQSFAIISDALGNKQGDHSEKAANLIAINAGAALYVAGCAADLQQGVAMAQDAIESGLAKAKISDFAAFTRAQADS